jgi:carboxypeptidase Taq
LEKLVDLRRRWAGCFDAYDNPYDALLDWFEPGMTYQGTPRCSPGSNLGWWLVSAIAQRKDAVDASVRMSTCLKTGRIAYSREVTEALGYDYQRGRLDLSAHPFTTRFSMWDVRITTRLMPDNPMKAIMSSIHEAGHAMHGQAIRPALYRTGLDVGPMQAISESQSRFFENVIGRSLPFWQAMYPTFQRSFAPHFDRVRVEAFYRAINHVEPGLIRVEADEVTYGLHIMLRFELENALMNGQTQVADLPREWNDRMEAYLGIRPSTDSDGVMQDIHWSQGMIGYFPDYLLGSMFSVQLWEAMKAALPDVEAQVARGDFGKVLAWQQEHVMQHGRKFTLPELAEQATHMPLSSEPYVRYLHERYGAIYGVQTVIGSS